MKYFWLFITLAVVSLLLFFGREGFGSTSPGTLIQLQSSHVPTMSDFYLNM
jgi:hypothetical protein